MCCLWTSDQFNHSQCTFFLAVRNITKTISTLMLSIVIWVMTPTVNEFFVKFWSSSKAGAVATTDCKETIMPRKVGKGSRYVTHQHRVSLMKFSSLVRKISLFLYSSGTKDCIPESRIVSCCKSWVFVWRGLLRKTLERVRSIRSRRSARVRSFVWNLPRVS